jgi:hypothetical protein
MSENKCPSCGARINTARAARFCPECGCQLLTRPKQAGCACVPLLVVGAGLVLCLLAFSRMAGFVSSTLTTSTAPGRPAHAVALATSGDPTAPPIPSAPASRGESKPAPSRRAETNPVPPAKPRPAEASAELQAQRLQVIKELQEKRILDKVEADGDRCVVWVRPDFFPLEFESKKTFISLVFAYWYRLPQPVSLADIPLTAGVELRDTVRGKTVGTYNPTLGLQLDWCQPAL